ncbi:hypothetical protein ACWC2T_36890 [Streptomyces sp. NPDC001393]
MNDDMKAVSDRSPLLGEPMRLTTARQHFLKFGERCPMATE